MKFRIIAILFVIYCFACCNQESKSLNKDWQIKISEVVSDVKFDSLKLKFVIDSLFQQGSQFQNLKAKLNINHHDESESIFLTVFDTTINSHPLEIFLYFNLDNKNEENLNDMMWEPLPAGTMFELSGKIKGFDLVSSQCVRLDISVQDFKLLN